MQRGNELSLKQREEERTVNISTQTMDNSQALVTVKDNGIGIDPEIVPRLFEKFISKSYQGTGLGLFISKSIIESHGGRIWAENNNNADKDDKEKGATFYFSLPLIKKQKHQPSFREEVSYQQQQQL